MDSESQPVANTNADVVEQSWTSVPEKEEKKLGIAIETLPRIADTHNSKTIIS